MRKKYGLFRFLYKLYFGIIYIGIGLLMYPLMFLLIRGDKGIERGIQMKRIWSRILCALVFVRTNVKFEEDLPTDKAYIFCPNHTSYLDIVLMYVIISHNIAFLGKSEILKWPIIGLFFKRGVDIPVYRDSKVKASDCLIPAREELLKGRSLVIFPEGKIPDHAPKLAPFKRGAFSLAMETGIPIVPITFYNNWRLFSDHTDLFGPAKPGTAKVKVHKPLYPKDFKDYVSLQEKTFSIIENELKKYENQR